MRPRRRVASLLGALLVLAVVAGCASVPASSPVQVLGQVGGGDDGSEPARRPVDGSNAGDLVRDFLDASAVSIDKHAAARRFLAPEAEAWDDSASLVLLAGQLDTVPQMGVVGQSKDAATIRIRSTSIGRITAAGFFEPTPAAPFQLDIGVVRRDDQWRISQLPDGVVVPLPRFQENYRTVRVFFTDPVRRMVVADLRYVPIAPVRAQPARVLDLLFAGPSAALRNAVGSQLRPDAELRSNVTTSPDGALVVDLTKVGDLDDADRLLLAAQIVLSLADVNAPRVRLLVDGEPLVPGRPDWTPDDVRRLSADVQPSPDVPALVTSGGRVSQLAGPTPLPGPVGNGTFDAESAASTGDGRRLAVVTRTGAGRTLLVGGGADGGVAPVALVARTMTRPSWTPQGDEVWTVLDSGAVARVSVDPAGQVRTGQVNAEELVAYGPISDLRLSRDGMRLVAVVAGGLYAAAVARSIDGEVAVRNVRRLRPDAVDQVVAADWQSSQSVVAITRSPSALVTSVSVDGLLAQPVPGTNLTPPLTAVAAAPNRPLLVTDLSGVWNFSGGEQTVWRQNLGGAPAAVPSYPG